MTVALGEGKHKPAALQRPPRRLLLPAALLLVYALQCRWFIRTQSITVDEPTHIRAGLEAWRDHGFEVWNDHPPLARLLCTLPLIDRRWQIEVLPTAGGGWRVPRVVPDPESMARRARRMNVPFGINTAAVLWSTAEKMFSRGAANLVLALFAFSPPLIAHFSLATADGAAVLFSFAAARGLLWWRENLTTLRTDCLELCWGCCC